MWISGTTQYALRAVLYVAEHGVEAPVRVGPIAAALKVPRNYLSKTLHALARAGVLRSERGPRGGFQLTRSPGVLTLAEVAAPFDNLAAQQCLLGRATCGRRDPCSVHSRWEEVSNDLRAFFRRTTIQDLLGVVAARPGAAPDLDVRTPPVPARGPRAAASRRTRRRP